LVYFNVNQFATINACISLDKFLLAGKTIITWLYTDEEKTKNSTCAKFFVKITDLCDVFYDNLELHNGDVSEDEDDSECMH